MSIKNHHQSKIKKVFTFSNLSTFSKTSAVSLMLLFCTNSDKTAFSKPISSEEFVSGLSIRKNLLAETGVPAGVKFREQIKIYNKYRFEDSGLCPRGKEKIIDFSI